MSGKEKEAYKETDGLPVLLNISYEFQNVSAPPSSCHS